MRTNLRKMVYQFIISRVSFTFTRTDSLRFLSFFTIFIVLEFVCSCSSIAMIRDKQSLHYAQLKKKTKKPIKIETEISSEELSQDKLKPLFGKKSFVSRRDFRKVTKNSDRNGLNLHYSRKLFNYWIKYFSKSNKKQFIRFMNNGEKFKDIVLKIMNDHGLPGELFFVGLIESGFYTLTKSHANAVGPWQFIKGTATRYGLRVDSRVDERSNIYKATEAAARYFKDLYNIFGNWELALCGYNAGEYKIINAIRKGNSRKYLDLVRKGLLPKETVYYISKVAAAKEIYNNRTRYSMPKEEYRGKLYNDVRKVRVRRSFYVKDLIQETGVSLNVLKKLNPDLRTRWISVSRKAFNLYLPLDGLKKNLKDYWIPTKSYPVAQIYKVKRGDTLTGLSRRFRIPMNDIILENRLKSKRLLIGQKLRVPEFFQKGKNKKKKKNIYVVRKGDYLEKIAKKFGTSVKRLVKLNSLNSKKIYPNQRIYLPSSM